MRISFTTTPVSLEYQDQLSQHAQIHSCINSPGVCLPSFDASNLIIVGSSHSMLIINQWVTIFSPVILLKENINQLAFLIGVGFSIKFDKI